YGRRRLGAPAHLVHRSHARWAAESTRTRFERLQATLEQERNHVEHPLGEADASGVTVIKIQGRVEALGLEQAPARGIVGDYGTPWGGGRVAEPRAEVADVAEQEDRREVMEQIADSAQGIDQLLPRRAQARQQVQGNGQPGARRLHLLL